MGRITAFDIRKRLGAQNIEDSASPLTSPIFVIKKKYEKWILVTDLRAISKLIWAMGSLHPGIPLLEG